MGALADGSLTPMIAVISVGTGVTMPMTATALAREVVGAGKGIQSVLHMIVFPLRKQYLPSGVMDTEGNGLFFFLSIPGPDLDLALVQGLGPVAGATAHAHTAVVTAGMRPFLSF